MKAIRRLLLWWLWPVITKEEALQIAKQEATSQSWPWLEPVDIWSFLGKWIIHTNSEWTGMNVRIEIDKNTGEIIRAGYNPR